MDEKWALEQCERWLWLHERAPIEYEGERPKGAPKAKMRGTKEERSRISNRVHVIADALYDRPGWNLWSSADGVRQLMFELEEGAEVRARVGLDDPGPALAADSLHPWVWSAAQPHWDSGNHDAAVWAAAINVNSQLKLKAERPELGESALVRAAFGTDDPQPGKARLRLCDRSNPDLFKDRHVGAINLGSGLFSGVRNPLNHVGAVDLTEQEALETLAGWSLLSRWIDRAEVERG